MKSLTNLKNFRENIQIIEEGTRPPKPKPTAPAEIMDAVRSHPNAEVMLNQWDFRPNERSGRMYINGAYFPQYTWIDKKDGYCEYRFKSRGHIYGGETLPENQIGDLLTLLLGEYFKRGVNSKLMGITMGDFQREFDKDKQWMIDNFSYDPKKFYASLVDKIKGESFKSSSVDLSLLDLGPLKELEKNGFVGVREYDMDSINILKKQIQVAPRLDFMNDIIKDFFNPFGISFEPHKSYRAGISFGIKLQGKDGVSIVNQTRPGHYRDPTGIYSISEITYLPEVKIKAKSKEELDNFFYEGLKKSMRKWISPFRFNFQDEIGRSRDLSARFFLEPSRPSSDEINDFKGVLSSGMIKANEIYCDYIFENKSKDEFIDDLRDLIFDITMFLLSYSSSYAI